MMGARAGSGSGEVLVPAEVWDTLRADPRLHEFEVSYDVEVSQRQGSDPHRGVSTVCLSPRQPSPWHWLARAREEFIRLCGSVLPRHSPQPSVPRSLSPAPYRDPCPICLGEMTEARTLDGCGHSFCPPCIQGAFQVRPVCPVCGFIYGVVTGDQPLGGSMSSAKQQGLQLPGYEGSGSIQITYTIPSGIQGPEHPNPGQAYRGTTRVAYLPDCSEGRKVYQLLKKAFDQRLIFTVGTSRTTGQSNVVTWNDIHHKTSPWGGPERFGYPDPSYLERVQQELAAKGITAD
ncbi:probable E3 ubiquitin-protein ligase DTX3 [Rhincodon typus]|uniref:probable E3 ubiquitin-protein ligase DTX3 n=1 Tax=Rhincodon typus TaxID=259920 RepID=UPI0020309DA6|nr:probable E3 ubiquitin-protein ligase DTX3 [Rhincodon typus]